MRQILLRVLIVLSVCVNCPAADNLNEARESLARAVGFFYSTNTHGGYVYYVTPDLSRRWGENPADNHTIEVQPPGTPAVGMAFLSAYRATGDPAALKAARDAAFALIAGQNKLGGWEHTIRFDKVAGKRVSFDDNQTQSAISFLMELDRYMDDEDLDSAIKKSLQLMLDSQLENGGWPHVYPEQGNYHDYATFNDGGINDCIRVMMEAHEHYRSEAIEKSLKRAARFLMISQLPPPQPGWAQQYNEYLQPAWARTFEPPSVCPAVTIKNIHTLIDLFVALGDKTLLEPIPDSLRWLKETRLENGKWARFVEIGTGKPLYYDRDRIRVDSLDQLHPERGTGYAYETDLGKPLESGEDRYTLAMQLGRKGLQEIENPVLKGEEARRRIRALEDDVVGILQSQDASGAWITRNDRFKAQVPAGERWNGQYEEVDRISSAAFIRNVRVLCEYIELCK